MRSFMVLAFLLTAATGCGPPGAAQETINTDQPGVVEVSVASRYTYVIDLRSHSCFLKYEYPGRAAMAPVNCARLAQSDPELAKIITWATPQSPTAPPSEPQAPPATTPSGTDNATVPPATQP